jgi:acyl-CoA thioester hydrolase
MAGIREQGSGIRDQRYCAVPFLWFQKKVHWSDTDAAGIVWFPNFLGWFEDAEEELYRVVLGQSRQSLLDELAYAMPRVEASAKYRAPVRAGDLIRIGLRSVVENPRRMRHEFEMRDASGRTVIAEGFVRVASVDQRGFTPRDFPAEILAVVAKLPDAIARQDGVATSELPWV